MKQTIFNPLYEMKNILMLTSKEIDKPAISNNKKTHSLRVMSKKLRSLLRLIKPSVKNKESVKTQNQFYKELSKDLSQEREAKVMHDTFLQIIEKNKLSIEDFLKIQTAIKQNLQNISDANIDKKLQVTKQSILKAINDLDSFQTINHVAKDQKRGFENTYKKAYDSLNLALKTNDIEDIHTFRKYAKYHMYQIQLLGDNIKYPSKKFKALEKLTSLLGKCNDIEIFEDFLHNNTDLANSNLLAAYAQKEQKRLTKKALKLASKIFAEDPKKIKNIL